MELVLSFEESIETGNSTIRLYNILYPFITIIKNINYGAEFTSIGVIPTIMSARFMDSNWKERRQIWYAKNEADIRLIMDLEKFCNANDEMKLKLYAKTIIDSIMYVDSKKKGDFNGKRLCDDLLKFLNMEWEDVKDLVPEDQNYPITRSAAENNMLAVLRDPCANTQAKQKAELQLQKIQKTKEKLKKTALDEQCNK